MRTGRQVWRKLKPVSLWPSRPPCGLAEEAEAPTLQPLLPNAEHPTAAVVICPGGGYERLAPHEGEPVARWLAEQGVAGLVLRYRVAPHRYPAALCDVLRAIRLVRSKATAWNVDPGRVGVLGFSAGGHLAGSAATQFDADIPQAGDAMDAHSPRPDAAVLCYPVVLAGAHGHAGSLEALHGIDADTAARQAFSLDQHVTPVTPPTFLWHTADDAVVDVRNSLAFAAACREQDVPAELHIFPTGRHGLGLADGHPAGQWVGLCEKWLAGVGFIDPHSTGNKNAPTEAT